MSGSENQQNAMRVGVFFADSDRSPEEVVSVAREAERLGFDSLWVPDHILKVFGPLPDPLTLLSFLAGTTERITLGTAVLVLPYRHPVVLANMLSSLDMLSGGRLTLGIGVGWNEKEFDALGMSKKERGHRTDESLEVLEQLWSEEKTSYDGRFYSFEEAEIGLKPHTPGGPPVLVGGYSDAAFRRAARFGAGWMGFKDDPSQITQVRERLIRTVEEFGRDPTGLEIGTTLDAEQQDAEHVADELTRLSEAGATFCALTLPTTTAETLAWAAEKVVPRAGLRLTPEIKKRAKSQLAGKKDEKRRVHEP